PDARTALGFDEAYLRVFLGDREGARRALQAYVAALPAVREYVDREPVLRGLLTPAPARPPAP
ncbi:MAG TPA: hypothetical protein VFX98_19480, partial [Longimicrobiaceae bacterium]|nr:hypothetical protein [Longimicrobiaceae bacterium]